ncbi:phage minor head protein [Clostridium saccharoperbutylacetonicum]|uniref:phage head morphogenesis protein n=1 Tax=Clostridium saccharoperbutylacetonicum TaxID=36745 RepID=UPI0039EC94E2
MKINKTAKDLWEPKRRIEIVYQRSLRLIMRKLEKELKGKTTLASILKTIKKFMKSEEFNNHAYASAKKMVTSVFTDEGKTWRTAANVNSKGRQIYEALKHEIDTTPIGISIREQTERNATLIKSMPERIRVEITDIVARESINGRRASEIAEDLQERFPEMLKAKADLIARTETSKTSTALTKARCDNLGIKAYIWRSSEDGRVRDSHKKMDDVIIFWNDPPSPEALVSEKNVGHYHPGNIYNCRCYPEPIIRLDFISWPHKVYWNNQIVRMSRKQFEEVAKLAA